MNEVIKKTSYRSAHQDFDMTGFAQAVEDAYLSMKREPHDRPKFSFSPSGLGWGSGRCPRFWYYSFEGGIMRTDDTDALSVANMEYGSEAHKRLGGLFKRADMLIDEEIKIEHKNPPIFGFVDLLVRWHGEAVVGEIKTAKQESFIFRKTSMKPPGYHLIQLLIYMRVMRKDKGFFLYENKNNQELLVIPVVWTEENTKLADDVFSWMSEVHNSWKDKKLPKRPFTKRSKHCKECPFYTHCWNDKDGEAEIYELEIPK